METDTFSPFLQQLYDLIVDRLSKKNSKTKQIVNHQVQKVSINNEEEIDFFSLIPYISNIEHYEQKTYALNLHCPTRKRQDYFKRLKREQEQIISEQRKEHNYAYAGIRHQEKMPKTQFILNNERLGRQETLTFTPNDIQKLRPQTDLNDTIIQNFLKILQCQILRPQVAQKIHIFSSFFFEKLMGQLKESMFEKNLPMLYENVESKVQQNYKNVRRWTKNIDLFEKQYIVIPINAFCHWFCIIVINLNKLSQERKSERVMEEEDKEERVIMAYCDSMFEKQQLIVRAIRKYLSLQMQHKKNVRRELSDVACVQLLTNTHDCGLYMLSYIELLLENDDHLRHLHHINCRDKLRLFPRALIFTMRSRLRKLFYDLLAAQTQHQLTAAIQQYKHQQAKIIQQNSHLQQYDIIIEKQLEKYVSMNGEVFPQSSPQEKLYAFTVKFHLDCDINYYQKDK